MRNFTILVLSVLLFTGCGKNDDNLIDASVTGKIYLYHSSSFDGVKITARSGDIDRSTYSESDGTYHLDGLKTGTYTFTFEKDGYMKGTWKGVSLVGGDEAFYLGRNSLFEISGDSLTGAEIDVEQYDIDYMTGNNAGWLISTTVSTLPQYRNTQVVIFVSEKPDVAYNRYDFILSERHELEKPRFNKGDHFYARAYLTQFFPNPTFKNNFDHPDPETGAMVYYGIIPSSASEVLEFTLN